MSGTFHREATCQTCGKVFPLVRTDRKGMFCSRACAGRDGDPEAVAERAKRAKREATAARWLALGVAVTATCPVCSGSFERRAATQKMCSPKCRKAATLVPRKSRPCVHCGETVTGTASKRECARCQKVGHKRKRPAANSHRRRARKFGVRYVPVNAARVFERDGWRCQICGMRTPKRLRGTMDPRAPELDHRIPMALGGPHTYENCQAACRACNGAKGAKRASGQIPLWASPFDMVPKAAAATTGW